MQEGLDPTLGAILPLIGVGLGGLLAAAGRLILDRRAEAAELAAALRIMRDDLQRMRAALRSEDPEKLGITGWMVPPGWSETRSILARHLDDPTWEALRRAIASTEAANVVYAGPSSGDPLRFVRRQKLRSNALEVVDAALKLLEDL